MAGKKLLVADDSLTIQKVIRLALSNEGYDIQAVSDGNDATQQIAVFRPDVVLIDVSLPGKSAFEVKKAVNENPDAGDVRFVLMSSAFEKVDEAQIAELKFHGRLTKPFDPAHLRQVLNDVLVQPSAKKSPADEKISLSPPEDDDFSKPLQPAVEPGITDEFQEGESIVQELWDQDSKSLEESAARTEISITHHDESEFQVTPPAESPAQEDSDIRQLTESTIRMSGLDDFQWSVNETAKKAPAKAPESAAPAPAAEHDFGAFELSPPEMAPPASAPQYVGEKTLTHLKRGEPTLAPPAGMADIGDATFKLDPPETPAPEMPAFDPDSAASAPASEGTAAEAHAIPLSNEQVEQLLSRQIQKSLEETLEKMTQKILPEIAERVIKQEIHKLLSEQL